MRSSDDRGAAVGTIKDKIQNPSNVFKDGMIHGHGAVDTVE
jgi:hypothetical protein